MCGSTCLFLAAALAHLPAKASDVDMRSALLLDFGQHLADFPKGNGKVKSARSVLMGRIDKAGGHDGPEFKNKYKAEAWRALDPDVT